MGIRFLSQPEPCTQVLPSLHRV
uniref:Uncharacterized protein n=1 Tax=Arundo donax TaxID=35708 RepID=A0A0A9G5P5_ARUDO